VRIPRLRCDEARALLWPPEQPRLADSDVVHARTHVSQCAACRHYLSQDGALLSAYGRIRERSAPPELRDRVFRALVQGKRPDSGLGKTPRSLSWIRWGFAAALALLIGLGSRGDLRIADPAQRSGEMFLDDYLRRAVSEDQISSDDPHEIARFLLRELGLPLRPLDIDGLMVQGAEICLLEGRRGAMIVYTMQGKSVSHYLVPLEGTRERAPRPSAIGAVDEPAVVTWSTGNVEHALVGPFASERLLSLARAGAEELP